MTFQISKKVRWIILWILVTLATALYVVLNFWN